MKLRTFFVIAVFAAFTIYTTIIVMNHGYTGFIELALAEAWGGQMFIDLVIALTLFLIWMVPDARERGIPWVPYAIAILATGSVGALAYLVHRSLKEDSSAPSSAAHSAVVR